MNIFKQKWIVVWLLCLGNSSHVLASDTPIALPENANTAWVSSNLNQNGIVMSIRTFHSPDSVDDVLGFYRTAWFKEGDIPGFLEDDMLEWKLISQMRETENVVLQLKPTQRGGSTGFLSVAQLHAGSQPIDIDFPLPDATEEYATTYLKENNADVHTMTFITKQSISATSAFYLDRLSRKGWSMARQDDVKGSKILLFNRKDDRCEMVIQKLNQDDTVIFVNRVKRNV